MEESAREGDTFVPRVVKPQKVETGVESILYTSFFLQHHTLFPCSPPSQRDIDLMEIPWAWAPHLWGHSGSERCPAYSGLKITVCEGAPMELALLQGTCAVKVAGCANCTQEWVERSPRQGPAAVIYVSDADVSCPHGEKRRGTETCPALVSSCRGDIPSSSPSRSSLWPTSKRDAEGWGESV